MQTTFIYGLICPKTNQIKYIGKADDIKRRLRQHIYQSKYSDNNKNSWIKNLINENLKPDIEIIEEVSSDNWGYWEDFWIKYYRFLGFNLINEMNGGHGYGKHSLETIEKIRQSQSGENNSRYGKSGRGFSGKKHSDNSKKKMSEKKIKAKVWVGRKHSEETKLKMSNSSKGKPKSIRRVLSEETKRKISESLKNRNKSIDNEG